MTYHHIYLAGGPRNGETLAIKADAKPRVLTMIGVGRVHGTTDYLHAYGPVYTCDANAKVWEGQRAFSLEALTRFVGDPSAHVRELVQSDIDKRALGADPNTLYVTREEDPVDRRVTYRWRVLVHDGYEPITEP